ncbi:MAG: nucleoside transporter C-terminal domain-containing protein [Myxococcota bacterium]|nr:nucleoside transporter C-terminal domain-containing protein [Myxococcota bacterium]
MNLLLATLLFAASDSQPAPQQTAPEAAMNLKVELRKLHRVTSQEGAAEAPVAVATEPWRRAVSGLGLLVMIGLAWLISIKRKSVDWRLVAVGAGLQLFFGLIVLKTSGGEWFFSQLNDGVNSFLSFSTEGARFLFGNLVQNNIPTGTPVADPTMGPVLDFNQTGWASAGAYFAFGVLPTLIFFSSVMGVLYHLGVMQKLVGWVAWVMRKTLRTSGAESLSAGGNIFLGQTESPLLIRPYVSKMTESELMAVMVGGFATVAGGVMGAFVLMLRGYFPDIAGHLIAASVMSAPAALVMAKIMVPETEEPLTKEGVKHRFDKESVNVIDAAARGAGDGLMLALNVGAMLIAFVALVAMLNAGFIVLGETFGMEHPLTMERILGWLLAPLAWVMGCDWADASFVGSQLGVKTVVNEFVAYLNLAGNMASDQPISGRSAVILTYALCGFANFSSIAIQIGGIGAIAPERRSDLARLGLRAMIGGNLAAFMTACVVGMIL